MNSLIRKGSIRRFISAPFTSRLAACGVALVVGAAIVVPFFLWRYELGSGTAIALRLLNTHDLATIVAIMEQFDKGLRSGVLYPRWLPDINFGYGVATMVFYPPGLFYLSSLINAFARDWVVTVFIIAAGSSAASGLSLYRLSRIFYGRLAAAIAALLYILLPYRSLDLYWRGALPEFAGFALLPVVLYFAYMLGSEGRLRHYAGLGFFYGLYVMTHLPVGYLLTYALALYAVVWAFKSKDLAIALRIAGGMAIGLLLSAVYWLPAALEAEQTHEPVTGIFPYDKSFVTLLPGSNVFDDLVNSVFAYQTLALLIAIALLRVSQRNADSRSHGSHSSTDSAKRRLWWGSSSRKDVDASPPAQSQIRLWSFLALAATFMSTSFSIYVSKLIPKIQIAVPAWRWLAISSVLTCLIVGAVVDRLIGRVGVSGLKLWASSAALAAAIALNLWLTVGSVIPRALRNGDYVRPEDFVTTGFIPKGATYPDNLPRASNAAIHPEGGVVEITRWDPQHREMVIRVHQPGELRLKSYNFPGWTARIDGQKVSLSTDENGAQLLAVPGGRHLITVDFVDTAPRVTGKVLFALGLCLIVGLTTTDFVRKARAVSRARTTQIQKEENKLAAPTRPKTRAVVAGMVLAVPVIVGLMLVLWRGSSRGIIENSNRAPASLDSGSEVTLFLPGWDTIPVAVSERDLDDLINAISTRNDNRVEELIQSGNVFRVKARCRVRILETRFDKANVRIIEGESITLDGWVPERWIK